jgi:hypothetical protein
MGYYDTRGRWIATAPGVTTPAARPTILTQLSELDQQIADARVQRTLTSREYVNLKREAGAIRARENGMSHDRARNVSAHNEVLLAGTRRPSQRAPAGRAAVSAATGKPSLPTGAKGRPLGGGPFVLSHRLRSSTCRPATAPSKNIRQS